jgi:hypothetical protein
MNRNNKLTRFDTGGSHSENILGGIPLTNNSSVEENETKSGNFIYSDRIFLDNNIVSQYNLPKSLVGKSVADATKMIDNKFKGRNDKISQSTKNSMLSKIAEAQEAMKPQEPEMMQQEGIEPQMAGNASQLGQMSLGGNIGGNIDGNAITTGASGLYDMGDEIFGKSKLNTSGIQPMSGASAAGSAGSGALKGASTGAAIGSIIPGVGTLIGAGVGALAGGISGFIGGRKDERAQLDNNNRYAVNLNKQFSDQYSYGGELKPKKITKQQIQDTVIVPGTNPSLSNDRFKYAIGEQGGVTHGTLGTSGYYLYYDKKPGEPGFNPDAHREFVTQSGYDTYMKSPQGQQYRQRLQNKTLPNVQFSLNPNMNQMSGGGPLPYDIKTDKNLFINNFGVPVRDAARPVARPIPPSYGDLISKGDYETPEEMLSKPTGYGDYLRGDANLDRTVNDSDILKTKPGFGKQVWDNTKIAGKFVNDNLGNIARYAPVVANAYQLSQLEKPQYESLARLSNRYQPEYVDEAQLQNIAKQSMNNTVNAISQSGASQGQIRASVLGSQLQRTKALSDSYGQAAAQNRATNDRAQTFNLGVDQVNLQQSNNELDINDRNKGNYDTQKSKLISQLGNDVGNIGKEQVQKKIIAKTLGYKWDGEFVKSPDGNVVTDPDTGKPMTGEKLKALQSSKEKKALGGYLIKNKLK